MKRNRKSSFLLLAVMLLAVSGFSLASGFTPARAQNSTTDSSCGTDPNPAGDQPEANDVPDLPCESQDNQAACILIGAEVPDQLTVDDHADGEVNDAVEQSAEVTANNEPDAETNDDQQQDGETADDAVGGEVQDAAYTGTLKADEAAYQNLSVEARCAALQKAAKVTAEQAQSVVLKAHLGSSVVKVELDIEDGYLIYDVELSNQDDVKVDAGDGSILMVETSTDNQD